MTHYLENLLWPKSVAIVGAAPTGTNRTRGQLVRYLKGAGYEGNIYPVNPSYGDVDGYPCFADIGAVGQPIDVAVLALPAALIPGELEKCASAGVKHAVVISAGFVEMGPKGAELQRQLVEVAQRTGIRVSGPNCQGYFNALGKVSTTFSPTVAPSATPQYEPVSSRRIGIIAQSGGIGYSLFARGRASGLAFSYVVSSGNEADLTSTDFLDYMVQDERTDVIVLFCETVRNPERFVATLAEAERRGKPIIALKVGKSAAAQRAAASHTAALTGWDAGYRAVFDKYGVIQAEHPDEAMAIAGVFATCPVPSGRRTGIITVSGGGGALMADMLSANGLTVPELSAQLRAQIEAYIPSHGSAQNPVDVTLNSADLIMPTIELLEQSDEIDAIALVSQLASGEILPLDPVRARAIMDRQKKPIVTWTYTLPSEAGRKVASESGLFLHLDLRNCGRALGRLVEFGERRGGLPAQSPVAQLEPPARRVVGEHAAKLMLARFGIKADTEALAHSPQEAADIAARLGFPVALKVQSEDLPHKTEVGGVLLGLIDQGSVIDAYHTIIDSSLRHKPEARIEGVLVQRMAPKGHEIVVGMVNDPTFGPIMMVGLGGIGVELFGDVVHRPAPVSPVEAQTMLLGLKSKKLFQGFRGAAPVNLAPVAEFIAQASQIALDCRHWIAEMEFNPVIVHAPGDGMTIADALIIIKDDASVPEQDDDAPAKRA